MTLKIHDSAKGKRAFLILQSAIWKFKRIIIPDISTLVQKR